jgi:hypothetical protein
MTRAFAATLLATAGTALAGECTLTPALAKQVNGLIKPGMLLVHYCRSCGEEGYGPFPLRVRELTLTPSGPEEYWVNNRRYSAEDLRQAKESRTGRLADDLRKDGQTEAWMIDAMVRTLEMVRAQRAHDLRINGDLIDADYLYLPMANDRYRNLAGVLRCAQADPPELAYTPRPRDSATEEAPVPYVVDLTGQCFDGSCPGKVWKARQTLPVYNRPAGSIEVSALTVGEAVQPVRTRVHVTPVRASVVWDHLRFLEGDVVYLLDGQGEGYYRVWHYGEITVEDISSASQLVDGTARCRVPSKECWVEFAGYPSEVIWTLVRRATGQEGWVIADSERFDGMYE